MQARAAVSVFRSGGDGDRSAGPVLSGSSWREVFGRSGWLNDYGELDSQGDAAYHGG